MASNKQNHSLQNISKQRTAQIKLSGPLIFIYKNAIVLKQKLAINTQNFIKFIKESPSFASLYCQRMIL